MLKQKGKDNAPPGLGVGCLSHLQPEYLQWLVRSQEKKNAPLFARQKVDRCEIKRC